MSGKKIKAAKESGIGQMGPPTEAEVQLQRKSKQKVVETTLKPRRVLHFLQGTPRRGYGISGSEEFSDSETKSFTFSPRNAEERIWDRWKR